jgi:hypothetical protein
MAQGDPQWSQDSNGGYRGQDHGTRQYDSRGSRNSGNRQYGESRGSRSGCNQQFGNNRDHRWSSYGNSGSWNQDRNGWNGQYGQDGQYGRNGQCGQNDRNGQNRRFKGRKYDQNQRDGQRWNDGDQNQWNHGSN